MVRVPLYARNSPVLYMDLQPATAMTEPAYGSRNLVRHDVLELPLRHVFMLRYPVFNDFIKSICIDLS